MVGLYLCSAFSALVNGITFDNCQLHMLFEPVGRCSNPDVICTLRETTQYRVAKMARAAVRIINCIILGLHFNCLTRQFYFYTPIFPGSTYGKSKIQTAILENGISFRLLIM